MPTLLDMAGFEVGLSAAAPATNRFLFVEGAGVAGGVTPAIVTTPAPFPDTETYSLEIPSDTSPGEWNGKTYGFTEGDAFLVMMYVRFVRGAGVPFTNDIRLLSIIDAAGNAHLSLNLTRNGAVNDLQIVDAAGGVCDTIAGTVLANDAWRLLRMIFVLDNTAGSAELQVINPPGGEIIASSTGVCTGEDFYTGTASLGIRLQGERGPSPPPSPTTSRFGSFILFKDLSAPADPDEFITGDAFAGNYTIIGASPSKASAESDVDSSGNAASPPTGDLDIGTWAKAGDGLVGLGNRCSFTTSGDNGGVMVDHPADDARVTRAAIRYGMEWVWHLSPRAGADIDVFFGQETSGGFTVLYDAAVPGGLVVGYKRVEDVTGARVPELGFHAVIGFHVTATVGSGLHMNEGWVYTCFAYPLRVRTVNIGGYSVGKAGRSIAYAG